MSAEHTFHDDLLAFELAKQNELEALSKNATQGEWEAGHAGRIIHNETMIAQCVLPGDGGESHINNAAFIVACVNYIRERFKHKCELCGHPMPQGEEMFKYHGYSGPCPIGVGSLMPLRQRIDVACDSEGYIHRAEINQIFVDWLAAQQPPTVSATAELLRELVAEWRKRQAVQRGIGSTFSIVHAAEVYKGCADELEAALAQADRSK